MTVLVKPCFDCQRIGRVASAECQGEWMCVACVEMKRLYEVNAGGDSRNTLCAEHFRMAIEETK